MAIPQPEDPGDGGNGAWSIHADKMPNAAVSDDESDVWMRGARELVALNDFSGALELLNKVLDKKPVERIKDDTLILADQAEKAVGQVRESVRELLAAKLSAEQADKLAKLLSEGTWTHDHPITYETAKSFGLPVRSDIPAEFLDLMALYPQPVRHQPSVEYLPEPRRSERSRGGAE